MSHFDLGLIDGNAWSAASVDAVEAAINSATPVGTIRSTIKSTADTGWLLFNQTVTNAQTLHPDLWAVVPAAWKSGTSLVLPNLADKMLEGAGTTTLGATGGANSKTITANNLPVHVHAAPVGSNFLMDAGSAGPALYTAGGSAPRQTAVTGDNATTATPLDVTPAHLAITWQIKA